MLKRRVKKKGKIGDKCSRSIWPLARLTSGRSASILGTGLVRFTSVFFSQFLSMSAHKLNSSLTPVIEVPILAVDYEPPVGGVSSIERCQMWAEPLEPFGAHYFYFDGTTEECMLFSTLQADCRVIGGPKTAPHLTECPWTTFLFCHCCKNGAYLMLSQNKWSPRYPLHGDNWSQLSTQQYLKFWFVFSCCNIKMWIIYLPNV